MPASAKLRAARPVGSVPAPDLSVASVFLDFDGTLVDLAETPQGVQPDEGLPGLLAALLRATDGRTALVSGRSAHDVLGFLPAFEGIVVGGHGAEIVEDGRTTRHPAAEDSALGEVQGAARDFAAGRSGLIVEDKPTGVVLHYRKAPDLGAEVEQFVRGLAAAQPLFEYHGAKMAAELRPDGIGKDAAIVGLMGRPGWSGTRPVFFGDDTTDEPALAWVDRAGGIAVKVGEGDSAAPYRLADPASVRACLHAWIEDPSS